MRAVLDTNVVVSGIFFGGVPRALLEAWGRRGFELVLTPSIFGEYSRTCDRLGTQRPGLDYEAVLTTLVGNGTLVADEPREESITADPDDDKFMMCAESSSAVVVSGDRHLHDAAGWRGVEVYTPRAFLDLISPDGHKAI